MTYVHSRWSTIQIDSMSNKQDHKAVIIHLLMTVTPPKIPKQGQSIVMVRGGSRAWPWVNKIWSIFQIKPQI